MACCVLHACCVEPLATDRNYWRTPWKSAEIRPNHRKAVMRHEMAPERLIYVLIYKGKNWLGD